jgi:hypothetical protein
LGDVPEASTDADAGVPVAAVIIPIDIRTQANAIMIRQDDDEEEQGRRNRMIDMAAAAAEDEKERGRRLLLQRRWDFVSQPLKSYGMGIWNVD